MDTAITRTKAAWDAGALPRNTVSDAMESALNNPLSQNSRGAAALNGPVVLAQPPVSSSSTINVHHGKSGNEAESSKLTLDVLKGAFASAQDAFTSGYRTVSSSTDEFVHESPWKSIAFAVLGGVIVGMLAAR
jgi:ElaB/YqjD/DUF883 family membrane-anchored ribosome-binding protein